MIEQALRKQLRPTVNRRRRLYLALWLSACWFVSFLIGIGLIGAYWLWGWKSPAANWALCISTGLATILILYKSRRLRVDYKAVARDIEHKHPDLKALQSGWSTDLSYTETGTLSKPDALRLLRHATEVYDRTINAMILDGFVERAPT